MYKKVKIIHEYGVTDAVIFDDDPPEEIARIMSIAATIEEGNGNGKIRYRDERDRGRSYE